MHRSVWGRTPDGALHAATTWYAPTSDPAGIELPGEPGRWRITASTLLPTGATPVPEEVALTEITGVLAAHEAALAQARDDAQTQRDADVAALVAAGVPADVAARLLGAR